MAFLDNNGLGTLWGRIKTKFGTGFADLVKDSSSVTIKLQNGFGNDLDTVAIPLADSTNSKAGLMSPTEKSKLAGIAAGAEVNVQSDWNATSGDAFIKNKPTIPAAVQPTTTTPKMDGTAAVGTETKYARGDHVHPSDTTKVDKVEGKGLSTNDYTTADKSKLAGIAAGAEVNVLEGVQMDGTDLAITNKKVNVPIFTSSSGTADGSVGLVPAPSQSGSPATSYKFLGSNAKWAYVKPEFHQPTTGEEAGKLTTNLLYTYEDNTAGSTVTAVVPEATTSSNGAMSSADKTKLDGIAEGAEENVLEGVQINGTDLTITDKKVNVPIFTGATTSADGTQGLVPAPVGYTLERNLKSALLGATGEWTTVNMTSTRTGSDTYQLGLTFGTSSGTNSYTNLTVPIATSSQSGLLSSGDKTKVDYVDTGKSVSTYVSEQISTAMTGSAKYKGTVGTGGTVTALPTSGYKQGDYYVVCSAGTYAGESCEVGDMIFANKDYASGAVAADDWDIVQANITAMTTAEINAICV